MIKKFTVTILIGAFVFFLGVAGVFASEDGELLSAGISCLPEGGKLLPCPFPLLDLDFSEADLEYESLDDLVQAHEQGALRFLKRYLTEHQDEPHFGLLLGQPKLQIQQLREKGYAQSWGDFVPTGVTDLLAAVDFLNRALHPFQSEVDEGVKRQVIQSISEFLTISSDGVFALKEKEREIIFTGTAHEVLDLCARENKDLTSKLSFGFWHERFDNSIRAVAAALIVIRVYGEESDSERELDALFQVAKMGKETAKNFIKEIFKIDAVRKIMGFHLLKAAEAGNATVQYKMGLFLINREDREFFGFVEDKTKAQEYFSAAAAQGHPGAMRQRGLQEAALPKAKTAWERYGVRRLLMSSYGAGE